MNPPDPVNAFNGMSQGAEGFAQGNIGSSVGRSQGPSLGINRAATGGPNMDQSAPQPNATGATAQNATRQTASFGSFLSGLLPVAAIAANFIPGVGPLVSAGLGMVSGAISKNAAQQAANAALGNQSQIAGELASGPNLDPLIKQEQAGITSAVQNGNAANPGKLLMDALGQSFSSAISGVSAGRNQALESAAGIYGGQGTAAQAQAASINPFSGLSSLIPGNTPGAPGAPLLSGGAETAPGITPPTTTSGGTTAPSGGSDFALSPSDNPFASVTTQSVKPKTGAGSK